MKKKTSPKINKRGFTMVESLVAITILLIAVIGPLSLLATALRDSVYLRNEITANFLAQEGLEILTFYRDVGELNIRSDRYYCVDGTKENYAGSVIPVDDPDDCVITFDDGYYTHNNGSPTIFTRYLRIIDTDNSILNNLGLEEYQVISTVVWSNTHLQTPRSVNYETHLIYQ